MKIRFLGLVALWLTTTGFIGAAVISISAELNGGLIAPREVGDTRDFLTFEVLSTSDITLTGNPPVSRIRYTFAEFIGREDRFDILFGPSQLVWDCIGALCRDSPPMTLIRQLDPGIYVVIANRRFEDSYDLWDGYSPVNPEGGGFVVSTYSYTLEGDHIRGIDFREGNLDGTFTVTRIPEPGVTWLMVRAGAGVLFRRRRVRQFV